jgi:hypothetical protein
MEKIKADFAGHYDIAVSTATDLTTGKRFSPIMQVRPTWISPDIGLRLSKPVNALIDDRNPRCSDFLRLLRVDRMPRG